MAVVGDGGKINIRCIASTYQIYHDGSNSYAKSDTERGSGLLTSNGDPDLQIKQRHN